MHARQWISCRGLGWHLALMQLQRPSWLPVQIGGSSWGQGGSQSGGIREGGNLWGEITVVKSAGGSWQLSWALVSSVAKAVGILHRAVNHSCSCCVADIGSPRHSSLLQPVFIYLSFVSLWVVWNWSGSFMQWYEKLEKLVPHLILPFPARELFWTGKFPLGTEQCHPGVCDDAGKTKLSFFFFVWSYSQVFCSTVFVAEIS